MELLSTTIAKYVLTSMQLFQTHGLDEGVPLNILCVPKTSRPWTFLWGYLKDKVYRTKPRTIDALKLKSNVVIFPMTCFVTFANSFVHVISVVWTITIINLNICKHDCLLNLSSVFGAIPFHFMFINLCLLNVHKVFSSFKM